MRIAVAALAVLAASPAAARGGPAVEGNGQVTSEARDVPPFEGIRLQTSADVVVRVGPARAVRVKVDSNLQPLLRTEVRDGVLVLRSSEPFRPKQQARVEIDTPSLRRFDLDGQGDVQIDGGAGGDVALSIDGAGNLSWRGNASSLSVSIEGAGDMVLEGRAGKLSVDVEGSGDVKASGLVSRDVSAEVEGSGDVDVTIDGGTFTGSVRGSGDIHWRGTASVESAAVTGSGEISRRE